MSGAIADLERFIDCSYDRFNLCPNMASPKSKAVDTSLGNMTSEACAREPSMKEVNINNVSHKDKVQLSGCVSDNSHDSDTSISEGNRRKRKVISPIGSRNWDILDSQSGHALTKSEQEIHFAIMETMVSWMGEMQHNMQLSFNEEFEKAVDGMRQELLGHVEERMEVQDESLTYHSTSVDANEREIEELRERCLVLEGRLTKTENEVDELKEKLLAQEARSMRDNLTFFNIPEKDGEDCAMSLRKFLRREMSISREDMEKIVFDRVHRTGRARSGFNRIVVVKFSSYEGRQIVLSHIKHLDIEKKYGVNELRTVAS